MASIVFSNWKNGLDVRRSELTTQPGSLLQLQDAIINEGAEIENRYAFNTASAAAANTFGLEAITTGLLTFGSIADPGGWTAPVSYQRLQHPAVAEGGASVAMTSVICSCSFANAAWVVAKFADNGVFAYYNGTVIPAFRNGQVLTGLTGNDKIAQQMANLISAITGFYVTAITLSGMGYYFDMYSNAGLDYTPTVSVKSSAAGTIVATQKLVATQGIPEVLASGFFAIFGGSTGSITSIKINNVEVLGSTITYTKDNLTTAQTIVATINNFISTPQYSASVGQGSYNNFIYLTAAVGTGITPNTFVVKVTTTGDMILDNTFFTLPNGSGNACQYVKIGTSSGTDILGTTVTQTGDVPTWAAAIATQINAHQSTYNAFASGSSVYISKKVRASNDTFETLITVSLTTGVVIGNNGSGAPSSNQSLIATASPSSLNAVVQSNGAGISGVATCSISGGVAPYSYLWSESHSLTPEFTYTPTVKIFSPTKNQTTVGVYRALSGTVFLQCQVTDSAATPNVTVSNVIPIYVSFII